MRAWLLLLLILLPRPALAGALEELRGYPAVSESSDRGRELARQALAESTLDQVLAALPTMPSPWVRYHLLEAALPQLVRERPERVLEAVDTLREPRREALALAAAVAMRPEARWVEEGMARFPAHLSTQDTEETVLAVEQAARAGDVGPLFLQSYGMIAGEILIRAAAGVRPDLAAEALERSLEGADPYRQGGLFRGAVALAVLDRARAARVLAISDYAPLGDASGALDPIPLPVVQAADFRGLPAGFRRAAERAVVARLAAEDAALALARARGLEPGRFRAAALLAAAEIPGVAAADLRRQAWAELVSDPLASLDEMSSVLSQAPADDPAARQALEAAVSYVNQPGLYWSHESLDEALARAWQGPLRQEMQRLPRVGFEVLHADWIDDLDTAVQRDLATEDLAALEGRYASPAGRAVLLYRAALKARDRALAARIPTPQERAAAFLELGDLPSAAKAARACPEPLQRVYWLVRVGDAARDGALHREALEEMFREMSRERPEELRWGSRVLLGTSLYDRASALEVAFTRVYEAYPAQREALALRLGKQSVSTWQLMPLYRFIAARNPRFLPALLKDWPEWNRSWLLLHFTSALLPQDPAEASAVADLLPPGEDRDEMHAMVAVSLAGQGQWDRALTYLEKRVPSRWTRSQALRYMAMQVAKADPARARRVAQAIPIGDARKLTLRDLEKGEE